MTLTVEERAEVDLWLKNLTIEAQQLGDYIAGSPKPPAPNVRKNYEKSVRRFRQVAVRVAILERLVRP